MFKKMCKSRAVNVVFAVCIAVLLAVPFSALPAAAATGTAPYLDVTKTADPSEIWLQGQGTPDTTTVTLTINGQGDVQASHAPVDVVLIIDRSGSMGTTGLANAKTAAKSFVDNMGATDYCAVVSYSNTAVQEIVLTLCDTSGKTAIKAAIDGIALENMTAMGDGMHMANGMLIADAASGRPLISVLLTDGYHNWGSWTPTSAATEAVNNNITYYTIGLGYGVNTSQLQSIATQTGGAYYFAPSSTDLANIYDAISNNIVNTAGVNVVVTEILQSHIKYVGNATIPPDEVIANADGTTTLQWVIGSIAIGDTWEVSFDVASVMGGTAVPIDAIPGSKVTYTNWQGVSAETAIPQATVAVRGAVDVEVNVGPAYFAGQTVEVYILSTIGGVPSDVVFDNITIWHSCGEESDVIDPTTLKDVSTGLHKFEYELPDGATGGAYKIIVETSALGIYGTSSGIFQVIAIPLPWVLPIWVWALIVVGAIFILMVIAVRIAR